MKDLTYLWRAFGDWRRHLGYWLQAPWSFLHFSDCVL